MSGGHHRHHGDRKNSKHGDEAFEHVESLGPAQKDVHCRMRRVCGNYVTSA
jgi:hypothetical protein